MTGVGTPIYSGQVHLALCRVETLDMLDLLGLSEWEHGERTALSVFDGRSNYGMTYEELRRRALAFSDHLIETGIGRGDRIVIFSESRPEWVIALVAALRAGAIVVPVDPKLTDRELRAVVADAEPVLFLTSSRCAASALPIQESLPCVREPVLLDRPPGTSPLSIMEDLRASRSQAGCPRTADETALVVYTSGTTGNPNGVMTTFANLLFQVEALLKRFPIEKTDVFYSMLPLNHLLEFTGGLCSVLLSGAEVCYGSSLLPWETLRMMSSKGVTKAVTVPLFLKLLKRELEKAEENSGAPAPRERLGSRFKHFITGGAPLDPEVESFYFRAGIPVYQGYGLTECSPVVAVNSPDAYRFSSVGRPLDGVELRIRSVGPHSPEGEIQTRGPHVTSGYYRKDDLTRESIDREGWLKTGDLGWIDEDGYLFVTGRLKNLIVLGSGKKVTPEEVEAVLEQGDLIEEVCVLATRARSGGLAGSEEVCAVIVPSREAVRRHEGPEALLEDSIRTEVASLAAAIAPYKRPSRVVLHPGEFPKTASRKVRRRQVAEWLQSFGEEAS